MVKLLKGAAKGKVEESLLFICYTPFHLALVQRFLMSDVNLPKCLTVVYFGPENFQAEGYCTVLRDYGEVDVVSLSNSRFKAFCKLFRYLLFFDRNNVDIVFSANYKLMYTRLFLFCLNTRPKLFRFDDGMGDLLEKSWFTLPEHPIGQLFFRIFSPALQYSRLREIPRRFSLYARFCGPQTKKISLNDIDEKDLVERGQGFQKVTILLGQTYSNNEKVMTRAQELAVIKSAITKYQVDKFIPHPLSKLDYGDLNTEVIVPAVIAEEYVAQLLSDHRCHVIGFRTTAIFNLSETFPDLISANCLSLTNLTVCKNGQLLSEDWISDIWSEKFDHVAIHV
jgi:hypothetical protein